MRLIVHFLKTQEENQKYHISCSSFQVSLDSQTIMSNISDINVVIPSASTYVPDESLITSDAFSSIIAELCNAPFSLLHSHHLFDGSNILQSLPFI